MILVCAATGTERDACVRGIADAGASAAKTFEVIEIGVGSVRAAAALRDRLARGPRPVRVVSSGFAGMLTPGAALGSWFTARALFEHDGVRLAPLAGPSPLLLRSSELALVSGDLVSVERLVGRESSLRRLARAAAMAVDMESAALAREAAAQGIDFSVARMISDTPEQPLPDFLAPFTEALAGSDLRGRLSLAARGIGGALVDPRGVAHLVTSGRSWTRQLRDGWRLLAATGI